MEAVEEPDVTQALEIVSDIHMARTPERVIDEAQSAAKALKGVLAAKKNKFMLRGEQYLQFEDWQTLGRFYGVTARVRYTRQVSYGESMGFEAQAEAVRADGVVISAAEAMCMDDEANWKGKPIFQLRSMAQTRACAKALRNVLSWVAVLAGYAPTPAEEMTGQENGNSAPAPACPDCGGAMWDNRTTKKGRQPDYKCKDKACNKAVWLEDKADKIGNDQVLRDQLLDQADKLLVSLPLAKRQAAMGRLVMLDTETMGKKVAELSEKAREKSAQADPKDDERQAKIKNLKAEFPIETINDTLRINYGGASIEDLPISELDALYADLIPF